MTDYIITEEELLDTRSYIYHEDEVAFSRIESKVRSHPIQKTREIPLTKGKVALVDDGDYESLNKHKWTALKNYNTFYAKRESGGKTIYMHRVILGTQPGFETDHIDGNGLNNQKYNLRFVSVRENGQNRHQEKTSRFPGVSKFRNKWKSQCLIGKERIYLGLFDTEEEAFAAYKKAVGNVESPYQSERDKVLDDCCNIDLTEYTRGERESDEVGLCRGRECNYCGRYNAEPRQSKTDPVFISCNTPAHAFRLDLKNEQSERYCLWIEDDDGVYQTSCLHSFEIMNGTPETNGIKFCPYCGKLIRQSKDGEYEK